MVIAKQVRFDFETGKRFESDIDMSQYVVDGDIIDDEMILKRSWSVVNEWNRLATLAPVIVFSSWHYYIPDATVNYERHISKT